MIESAEIQRIIPHRYPFLLIDRIIELEEGKSAVGIKNVSANEPFFQGHFPENPIMPGVLMIEMMAQVGLIVIKSMDEYRDKLGVLAGIDKIRFKKQIRPGDTLKIEIEITKLKMKIGVAEGKITADGDLVCQGRMMFGLVD